MGLPYDPADAVMCWPKDDYDASLVKVEEAISKTSGNPMEVWTFEVFNKDGRTQLVSDYVVIPGATFKIRQLAKALNRESDFKDKKFQAEQEIGCNVIVELTIENQQGYDDKNKIGKIKPANPAPDGAPAAYPRSRETVKRAAPANPFEGEATSIKAEDIPF